MTVAQELSSIVSAPGYPAHMAAKERSVLLKDVLQKFTAEKEKGASLSGLVAALDNPVGNQIVNAAKAKCAQLEQSLSKCDSLRDLWHECCHGSKNNVADIEDAVRSAPSSEAAREVIKEHDLQELHEAILEMFLDLHFRRKIECMKKGNLRGRP